jgi:Carboxypeptidase regulatory-like domain
MGRSSRVKLAVTFACSILLSLATPAVAFSVSPDDVTATVLESPGSGSISGRVTDRDSGLPIPGVAVAVYDATDTQVGELVPVAEDGTYRVPGVEAVDGPFRVCFAADALRFTGYASQCYRNAPWSLYSEFPIPIPGDPVDVVAGIDTGNVDVALQPVGSIAGTVTDAITGGPLENVIVTAHRNGLQVTYGSTDVDGRYELTGLSPTEHLVCFDPRAAIGGGSPTGNAGSCVGAGTWNSQRPVPADARPIAVLPRALTDGIDIALGAGGSIAGMVTGGPDGAPLGNIRVSLLGDEDAERASTTTAPDGSYRINGITPSDIGYAVCFQAADAVGGSSIGGYRDTCHPSALWDPEGPRPDDAAPVVITESTLFSGIDGVLPPAAGITGRVTYELDGSPLPNAVVRLYEGGAESITDATTGGDGSFVLRRLAPSADGYQVCVDAHELKGAGSPSGFTSRCHGSAPADVLAGPIAGATSVVVPDGITVAGIDVALRPAGGISGTVTAALGGQPLESIGVVAFDAQGQPRYGDWTDEAGRYGVPELPAGTGYRVCFFTADPLNANNAGWAAQCHAAAVWVLNQPPPTDAAPIAVMPETVTSRIDAALRPAAGISGRITSAATGEGLALAFIEAFAGSDVVQLAYSRPDGSYILPVLPPSETGYTVCVRRTVITPEAPAGYRAQCHHDVEWDGDPAGPAAGSLAVPVPAETTVLGVDVALQPVG